jgi:hypothetical protein
MVDNINNSVELCRFFLSDGATWPSPACLNACLFIVRRLVVVPSDFYCRCQFDVSITYIEAAGFFDIPDLAELDLIKGHDLLWMSHIWCSIRVDRLRR